MADNDWKVERGSWSTSEKVAGLWESLAGSRRLGRLSQPTQQTVIINK